MFTNRTQDRMVEALHVALDTAAPDQESWIAGESAFNDSLTNKEPIGHALVVALDTAAPDQESWIAGREAFYVKFNPNPKRRRVIPNGAFSPKQKAASQPQSEGS